MFRVTECVVQIFKKVPLTRPLLLVPSLCVKSLEKHRLQYGLVPENRVKVYSQSAG